MLALVGKVELGRIAKELVLQGVGQCLRDLAGAAGRQANTRDHRIRRGCPDQKHVPARAGWQFSQIGDESMIDLGSGPCGPTNRRTALRPAVR